MPIKIKKYLIEFITFLAIVFFLLALDHFNLWFDEQGTLIVINQGWIDLLKSDGDPRHPTFYFLMTKVWYQMGLLFKSTPPPYYLKLFPFLFGLATYFYLLKNVKSSSQKLYFAILFLTTPSIFIFFQEFRSYTMMAFFLAMGFLSFEKGQTRRACLWSLFALGTHYFASLFLAVFLFYDFFDKKKQRKKIKILLIPFIIVSFFQLTKIIMNFSNPIQTEFTLNFNKFFKFFSQFLDPFESLPTAFAVVISIFILSTIFLIEMRSKTQRSTTDRTFVTLTLLFWAVSIMTRDTYSSPRYLYPLIAYFPFYVVKRTHEKQVKFIVSILSVTNLFVFFQPKWGVLEFENRPLYEEAFKAIAETPQIKKVSICHRYKELLPNHFFYYPTYLNLSAKVEAFDCNKEEFTLPSKERVILILKDSPWWERASQEEVPIIFTSRRILVVKALPK